MDVRIRKKKYKGKMHIGTMKIKGKRVRMLIEKGFGNFCRLLSAKKTTMAHSGISFIKLLNSLEACILVEWPDQEQRENQIVLLLFLKP